MQIKTIKQFEGIIQKEGNLQIFTYKGFVCLIRRNFICEEGLGKLRLGELNKHTIFHLCGYVGLPKWHKFYKKNYDKINIDCHGGLTFSGFRGNDSNLWFIGFDCGHAFDQSMLSHNGIYRDVFYVKKEIRSIVNQLIDKDYIKNKRKELEEIEQELVEDEI